MEEKVIIYTDGACSGNPGPGGWGAILMYKGVKKEISRIRWTSKKELVKYSVSTVAFMIFFGVFFYAIDLLVALLRSKI